MAMTNHERVGKALELLRTELGPWLRDARGGVETAAARLGGWLGGDDRIRTGDPLVANKPTGLTASSNG